MRHSLKNHGLAILQLKQPNQFVYKMKGQRDSPKLAISWTGCQGRSYVPESTYSHNHVSSCTCYGLSAGSSVCPLAVVRSLSVSGRKHSQETFPWYGIIFRLCKTRFCYALLIWSTCVGTPACLVSVNLTDFFIVVVCFLDQANFHCLATIDPMSY
jgi:hypothetical protein